jgi:hypothetical protein
VGENLLDHRGLLDEEFSGLKFHFETSSWGGTRKLAESLHGARCGEALERLAKSPCRVQVNIEIMRAFVRLRELVATNRDLARRLDELEKRYGTQFKGVFDAVRQLMAPPRNRAAPSDFGSRHAVRRTECGGGRGGQVGGQGWNKGNKLGAPIRITGRVVAGIVSGRIDDYHQFELVADPQ